MKFTKLAAVALAAVLGLTAVSASAQDHRSSRSRDHRPAMPQRFDASRGHQPTALHNAPNQHGRLVREAHRSAPHMTNGVGPHQSFHPNSRQHAEY